MKRKVQVQIKVLEEDGTVVKTIEHEFKNFTAVGINPEEGSHGCFVIGSFNLEDVLNLSKAYVEQVIPHMMPEEDMAVSLLKKLVEDVKDD